MSNQTYRRLKIGIVGMGMVGEQLRRWFEEHLKYRRGKELFCFDKNPAKGFNDDINKADIVFVAVPTPSNSDGSCDISAVENAVSMIGEGKIVVVKSTVPPGTVENLQRRYPRKRFIFNPEFLTESQAWLDFIRPDRQIVACPLKSRSGTGEVLALLPRAPFERPWASDYIKREVNTTEAEMAKYAANVFGYIKVVYGNILADLCYALSLDFDGSKLGAVVDYENVREVISADPRIGPAWLNVEHGNYCGVGGSCLVKDMNAFIKFAENLTDKLSKGKRAKDPGFIRSLKKGIGVLKAVVDYNKTLLSWQGLTIDDVSRHNKEVVINERKPIRKIETNRKKP